jgi:hypothetical protein
MPKPGQKSMMIWSKMQKLEKGRVFRADTQWWKQHHPSDGCPVALGQLRVPHPPIMKRIGHQMPLFYFFADRRRCCKKLCYKGHHGQRPKSRQNSLEYTASRRPMKSLIWAATVCAGYLIRIIPLLEKLDHFLTLSAVAILFNLQKSY